MVEFSVILPAAGLSSRFGRNKLAEIVGGVSVLRRSVEAFVHREDVREIVIPTGDCPAVEQLLGPIARHAKLRLCDGGATRAHSVWNGARCAGEQSEWVAVHDAARPLVSQALMDRTLRAAATHGAAVPACPVHLTIKQATGPLPARVERTLPRAQLWAMQTPQIMRRAALLDAFAACPIRLADVTDDVQLIELAGGEVWLVEGEESNLKITTPADIRLAELHLAERERA
jgi:2-C-methyl-D-erythritol 4-phosphate cytidylyltransferase